MDARSNRLAWQSSPPSRRAVLGALPTLALTPHAARAQTETGAAAFDSAGLARALRRADGLDQLHSLVIAKGGDIAAAEAFRGPPLDQPVNVKSISKTLVATLAGCAWDRGLFDTVDTPVADILADKIAPGADPRVRRITIADLLTMQAGLERMSGPNYGRWVASDDWVAYALNRPFVAEPGARMLYSTGSYHLLGVALSRLSGLSLLSMMRDWIADPLGVAAPPWTRDPQGHYLGGNEMALSPLALLRFGEMIRNDGLWDGTRILSADWLAQSWTVRTRSPFSGDDYGYGWFLSQAGGHPMAYARGFGGQMLYIVPALQLTVVITSDANRPARSGAYISALNALLRDAIIPAVTR